MNHLPHRASHIVSCRSHTDRGFALVATLSIMTLLVVVTLGMLSLSTITVRENRNASHMEEARANARMALIIAIGELQKAAGPDQRVSARADIRESVDPSKRYWTGFWDTQGWDPLNATDRKFVNWLVSSPDINNGAGETFNEEDVDSPLTGSELVTLVGQGSTSTLAEQVSVQKVPVQHEGYTTGHYAYWVGDEGIKASYRVPAIGKDPWNKSGQLGTAAKSGISSLDLDGYDALGEGELYSSGVSRGSMILPFDDKLELSRELFHHVTPQAVNLLTDVRLGGVRRDLSTAFEMPLKDFNAFEEFHAAQEQNDTSFYDVLGSNYRDSRFYHADESPDLGYVCEIPFEDSAKYLIANNPIYASNDEGVVRGPSWDLVRNHCRIYKKEWEDDSWERSVSGVGPTSFAARGSLPHSYSGQKQTVQNEGDKFPNDHFTYHIGSGAMYSKNFMGRKARVSLLNAPRGTIFDGEDGQRRTVPRSPMLSPIVTRMTVALGLVRRPVTIDGVEDWTLAFSFDPYMTIVNPYNVPITFDSIGLWCSKFNPINGLIEYVDRNNDNREADLYHFFSRNHFTLGSFTMRLDGGPHTLQPGEVRVISPQKAPDGGLLVSAGVTALKGSFDYQEDSGFYVDYAGPQPVKGNSEAKYEKKMNLWREKLIQPADGNVTVTLNGNGTKATESTRFLFSLYHKKEHTGGSRDIFTHLVPSDARLYGDEDILDQPTIANLGYCLHDRPAHQSNVKVERNINTSQIPQPGQPGVSYVAVIDAKMRTTNEGFPTFSVNPRGGAFDTRDYDGSDRSSPQWDIELSGDISDLALDLELVSDLQGHGYWGEGRDAYDGSNYTVLYEVPQLPVSSLAQLQHLSTGITGTSGSLQIGNSFPHPGIADRTQIATQREAVSNGFQDATNSQILSDMSWASNESLWDRYFFSGINWGKAKAARLGAEQGYATQREAIDALLAGDRSLVWPMQNPRMDLFTRDLSDEQIEEIYDHDKIAEYLAVFGGFNVNSTSQKAWQAIFSSLRKVEVDYIDEGGSTKTMEVMNTFSRFMTPSTGADQAFGSFRNLSDENIELLAEKMVQQVKLRGPFMGLADFVNRRLTTSNEGATDLGAVGALQAAIEAAKLNDGKWTEAPTAANVANVSYQAGGVSRTLSTYAGTSGYLMQGDILSSIGGNLSARSDTFVIRSYGSVTDKNGKVIAEAWCEATVQRSPQWVEETTVESTRQNPDYLQWTDESPILQQWQQNPAFPAESRKFGRKFKIQSFRWLNPKEV